MSDPRTIVVGAGQAGLAVSHELSRAGVEHLVLERGRAGQTWRGRWESFCLVTPNWTWQLPGGHYDGAEPDGFMDRDEIVERLERYAARAPLREGVEVRLLEPGAATRFRLHTNQGELEADTVVLATGAYQKAHLPAAASALPDGLTALTADDYRTPDQLPAGAVLVVGSGQTGCQLAEELHEAGREVFLACGKAPWIPRRLGGRDFVRWLHESGYLDVPVAELPSPLARLTANVQASGHGGGHDLHYRTLDALGVHLLGRLAGAEAGHLRFAGDLAQSVAFGDARYADLCLRVRQFCERTGTPPPDLPVPEPFLAEAPETLPLARLGAVVFTAGFRPDYSRWVDFPGAFDELGFPVHQEGSSTTVPGLHFVGVHFLRKRKSSLLLGVGEDAAIVARSVLAAGAGSREQYA